MSEPRQKSHVGEDREEEEFRFQASAGSSNATVRPRTPPELGAKPSAKRHDPAWDDVATKLREIGCRMPTDAIDAARTNGFGIPQVLALIEFLKAKPAGCDEPGAAIAHRLKSRDAVQWECQQNWPWMKPGPIPLVRSSTPNDLERQKQDEESARKQEFLIELNRLNIEFGAKVDAMSTADVDALFDQAMQASQSNQCRWGPVAIRAFRSDFQAQGKTCESVRFSLLKLVEWDVGFQAFADTS